MIAIGRMATFAKGGQERDDCLLYPLIQKAVNANQLTKEAFIEALAEYGAVSDLTIVETAEKSENALDLLITLTAFTDKPATTLACLRTLKETDQYKAHYQVQLSRREAAKRSDDAKKEREKADALLIEKVEGKAARLRDARDAIVVCLKDLVRPAELPEENGDPKAILVFLEAHIEAQGTEDARICWHHLPHVNLQRCFLTGADLGGSHLEGTFLSEAHLEGADLGWAHLEGTTLFRAHLEYAYLEMAHLEEANLNLAYLEGATLLRAHLEGAHSIRAHLEGADLSRTELEGANLNCAYLEGVDLIKAHLEGANLSETHLEGANLSWTHLEDADLSGAHLEGANFSGAGLRGCRLYDIQYGEVTISDGSTRRTNFSDANWKEADFKDIFDGEGEENQKLRAWFEKSFPYDEEERKDEEEIPEET